MADYIGNHRCSRVSSDSAGLRRCKGSARFGFEPHEAPVSEFPKQPSRKDGLGVMCTEHWRAYVKGLREARMAATASDDGATRTEEAPAA